MLTEVMSDLGRLSEEVHKFAFDIVFAQLKNYLANVSTMEVSITIVTLFKELPERRKFSTK